MQVEVDSERHDTLRRSALEILQNNRQAKLFADWGRYLLVGYEQSTLVQDNAGLEWIVGQLLDALDAGRFATVAGASAQRPGNPHGLPVGDSTR